MIHGVSLNTLKRITQYQLFSLFDAKIDEDEMRIKLAGFDVPEKDHVATLQDLMAFGA
jgi:hypothetical protein